MEHADVGVVNDAFFFGWNPNGFESKFAIFLNNYDDDDDEPHFAVILVCGMETVDGWNNETTLATTSYPPGNDDVSHLWKRKIIFPVTFQGDMLVTWRVLYVFFFAFVDVCLVLMCAGWYACRGLAWTIVSYSPQD